MTALYLLLGLWRSWLGGGIGKDWPPKFRTVLQYAALAALIMGATYPRWQTGLVDTAGLLLLARGYIHGPMLRFPLGTNPKDAILKLVGGPGGGTWRYLSYAAIRYVGFALPWAVGRWAVGANWWAPLIGAALIVAAYYGFTRNAAKLPTLTTLGDEAANWGEIVGWTAMGAVLYGASALV